MAELVCGVDTGSRAPVIKIAAFVVTRGRVAQLKRCIASLGAHTELRILVNGPDEATERALRELGHSYIRAEKALTPAGGRNRLLNEAREASYDWGFFIDDDAFVHESFFERFKRVVFERPDACVIGGPNLTPPESSAFQDAAGAALSCRLGSFLSSARYRSEGKLRSSGEEELILCNLFIRKDWIGRFRFPENYICAEENRLIQLLKSAGAPIFHDPELFVFHDRREGARSLARQVLKYGIGRGQNLRDSPGTLRLPYVLPSIVLVAALLLFVFALTGSRSANIALGVVVLAYALSCLVAAYRVSKGRFKMLPLCASIFPIIHFAYAVGVPLGWLRGTPK